VVRYRASGPITGGEEIRSGLYAIEINAVDLARVIARVQSSGGSVQDVLPKVSLETVFFRTIASSPDGKA
jgi:hypothetical protein